MMRGKSFLSIASALFIFLLFGTMIIRAESQSNLLFRDSTKYSNVLVKEVLSPDTIIIGEDEKIHLIGLKVPENLGKKRKIETDEYHIIIREADPIVTLGERALNFTKQLLKNKNVRLEFDAQRKDDNFNTVAYVFLPDGTFVNAEILRQGYANLKIVQPNTKYSDELRKAYQEARREKRGLQGE